jgi:hypothetical protein
MKGIEANLSASFQCFDFVSINIQKIYVAAVRFCNWFGEAASFSEISPLVTCYRFVRWSQFISELPAFWLRQYKCTKIYVAAVRFCNWFGEAAFFSEINPLVTCYRFVSSNGHVNTQNKRYSVYNPRLIHEIPLCDTKFREWISIYAIGIIWPTFFEI